MDLGFQNLFEAENHDAVIPLIRAIEERWEGPEGKELRDHAIQSAFDLGVEHRIESIVDRFHERPAILAEQYGRNLAKAWKFGKTHPIFLLLLSGADKDDLKNAKQSGRGKIAEFHQAIDSAFEKPILQ